MSAAKANFALGDDVFIVGDHVKGEAEATVVKTGRIWGTAKRKGSSYGGEYEFDLITGRGKPHAGFPASYRVFTPESLKEEKERRELLDKLKRSDAWRRPFGLPTQALREIMAIIEREDLA